MKKQCVNYATVAVGVMGLFLVTVGIINTYYTLGVGVKEFQIASNAIKFYNKNREHSNSKVSMLSHFCLFPNEVLIGDTESMGLENVSPVAFGYDELYLEEIISYDMLSRDLQRDINKYPRVRIYCPETNREILIYKQSNGSNIHRIVF